MKKEKAEKMEKLGIKKGRWEEAPKGNKMGILKPAGTSPRNSKPTVSSKGSKQTVLSPKNNKQIVLLQERAETPKP